MDSTLDRYREKVSSGGTYIAIGIGQKTKEKGQDRVTEGAYKLVD
jgi:hypothetical protein